MSIAEPSKVAIQLIKERSRDTLVEGLKGTLAGMDADESAAFLADLILTMGADRDHLKARLVSLLATKFGRSSEKSSPDQLQLFAEALRIVEGGSSSSSDSPSDEPEPDPAAVAAALIEQTNAEIDALAAEQRAQRKAAREAKRAAQRLERDDKEGKQPHWPTNLPVREETLELPENQRLCGDSDCDKPLEIVRYETSWRLEYSTKAEVVVTYIPVAACPSHHGGPVSLPVPPKPVDGGRLGFSLASRLLWLRSTHNLPVRRIAEMLGAESVPVSESMIHTLICTTGERVKPLVEAIQAEVQRAALVNLDDTPTDVHEGHRERKRRKARVWLALGDEKFAYFFATKTWKADEAEDALGPITGTLQGDGYKGFPKYARRHQVTLAGCLAHLRRKLQKAVNAHDPRASRAMALVQGLYRVEELARLQGLDADARLSLRQERSVPIMEALIAWAREVEPTIETGSPLGKAWTYLSNQLEPLQVFLRDGVVSIDNNAAERGLRRHTIGRKLWLFFRGQAKLEHITRIMSVVTTVRLHGADELAYLTWVLEQLARRTWSAPTARQLLPDAWLAMNEKKAKEVDTDEA